MSAALVTIGATVVIALLIVGIYETIKFAKDRMPPPDPPLAPA